MPTTGEKKSASPQFAAVAIACPLPTLFDYIIPQDMAVVPGCRVKVPFGRGNRIGMVVACRTETELEPDKLKQIAGALDISPLLDAEMLALLEWGSKYHHYPIGETIQTALPSWLAAGKPATHPEFTEWLCSPAGMACEDSTLAKAPAQLAWLNKLKKADINFGGYKLTPADKRALKALTDKGLIKAELRSQPAGLNPEPELQPAPALNPEQQATVDHVVKQFDRFSCQLLDGITGSGKTEVYLQLAAVAIEKGQQVLILTPEIGLTPQLVSRFRQRIAAPISLLHSGLTDLERSQHWLSSKDAANPIVIGTRSAVFTPMPKLGLIIIDEEHDTAYKQQDGWRYSARDMAIYRARQRDIPILLGSATPSLESLHNVERQRYGLLKLRQRAGKAVPPKVKLVDLRSQNLNDGLSAPLVHAIDKHLGEGHQALLFLNRRGYAPALLCHACGVSMQCESCDSNYTLHQRANQLRCHHCDHRKPVPVSCPACGSIDLIAAGLGTERIETALQQRFPEQRILRIDRDSMGSKRKLKESLDVAMSGRAQILLGTQMLAKGHDFPNVTLAAVVDADQALFSADFRATERLAQTLTQVIGRAGRGEQPGEVLLQTHQPDHPLLKQLLSSGYGEFAKEALLQRQRAVLPPHGHLALFRAESSREYEGKDFLTAVRQALENTGISECQAMGPVTAPMPRRGGRYRWQLLLKSTERQPLHRMLAAVVPVVRASQQPRSLRWSLDVDPGDLF